MVILREMHVMCLSFFVDQGGIGGVAAGLWRKP